MTNMSFVFLLLLLLFVDEPVQNNFKLTCKIVFNNGFPLACSLPMSLHHTLTKRTSDEANANKAVCFSNVWSSSPRSRPSDPSKSSTTVFEELSDDDEEEEEEDATAIHTPFVVCRRLRRAAAFEKERHEKRSGQRERATKTKPKPESSSFREKKK
tara:strand:- start:30 stop:497 length:468 start_codon:yes stop_codon:yes gene_type:complete